MNNTTPTTEGWEIQFSQLWAGFPATKEYPTQGLDDRLKSFIHTLLLSERKRTLEEAKSVLGREKENKHLFEVGSNRCKYCNQPRIVIDRKRVVIRRDEATGGELAEVTENRIDTTDHFCLQNTQMLWNDGYNYCLEEITDKLANITS